MLFFVGYNGNECICYDRPSQCKLDTTAIITLCMDLVEYYIYMYKCMYILGKIEANNNSDSNINIYYLDYNEHIYLTILFIKGSYHYCYL